MWTQRARQRFSYRSCLSMCCSGHDWWLTARLWVVPSRCYGSVRLRTVDQQRHFVLQARRGQSEREVGSAKCSTAAHPSQEGALYRLSCNLQRQVRGNKTPKAKQAVGIPRIPLRASSSCLGVRLGVHSYSAFLCNCDYPPSV